MNKMQKRCYLSLIYITLHLSLTIAIEPISSFSLQGFNDEKAPTFGASFTLLGDAQIANEGKYVNLTSGQIVFKKPFKFHDVLSLKPVSFSTDFTFLINGDNGNGDGLAFVIFPSGAQVFDNKGLFGINENGNGFDFVAVEYDTHKDDYVGDLNGNHIGVDVSGFVSAVIGDVSSLGLMLNGGVPLRSWIDYEASAKRLEVRLAEAGTDRPYQPLISYAIDLSKMWGDREVLVGISSSSKDSKQVSSLSSWSFGIRTVPNSLHSLPLDPDGHVRVSQPQPVQLKKSCFLTILGSVIFATGCGTLVAFFVLFMWVVFFGKHHNVASELPLNPVDFKYEKVNVTVDNVSDDASR